MVVGRIAVNESLLFGINEVVIKWGIGSPVEGAAGQEWLVAPIFHDVDFTLARPWRIGKQPDRGPHALRRRQITANFEPTVTLSRHANDLTATVIKLTKRLVGGQNDKVSAKHRYVFRQVSMQRIVCRIGAEHCRPLARIECSSVEFIEPVNLVARYFRRLSRQIRRRQARSNKQNHEKQN